MRKATGQVNLPDGRTIWPGSCAICGKSKALRFKLCRKCRMKAQKKYRETKETGK